MHKFNIFLLLIVFFSCSTGKIIRDHGECYATQLSADNRLNDTSKVKFIKSVVFDTSAILIHGYIVEKNSYQPIEHADVAFINRRRFIKTHTNSQGEFEIFEDLEEGQWNLSVKHDNYICIYVLDIVKAGGQWFYVKLEHK
jgi:hypothetical protein